MSLVELSPKLVYLAAGHIETGGTKSGALTEGHENIQVVEDALRFLKNAGLVAPGPGTPFDGGSEYALGSVVLVVLDHALDLAATITAINRHYEAYNREHGAENPRAWQHGVCLEVHFNAPSTTAKGPMIVHATGGPSETLGGILAEEMGGAVGLSPRHFYNQWRKWPGGGVGYGFINYTYPLAAIVECDEMHNPARAAVLGDDTRDDVYGVGIARAIARLAGLPVEIAVTNCRALHLGWDKGIDWPALRAIGPRAIVTCHAWQLPKTVEEAEGRYWLWRPWLEAGWPWWEASTIVQKTVAMWQQAGRPYLTGLQIGNEPNLGDENGRGDNDIATRDRLLTLWPEVIAALQQVEGLAHADVHTMPLSPKPGADDMGWWNKMGRLVDLADVLNMHAYWTGEDDLRGTHMNDGAFRWREVARRFPDKTRLVLSECGSVNGQGSRLYGEQLAWYWARLGGVAQEVGCEWAAGFLWAIGPGGAFSSWELQGTATADVLIATAPAGNRYRELWGQNVPYPSDPHDVVFRWWRQQVDQGHNPGPCAVITQPTGQQTIAVFEKAVYVTDRGDFWTKS